MDAHWTMLGAQSHMGDAQHQLELCDAQLSHRSDPLSDKSEWQRVVTSEGGVIMALCHQIYWCDTTLDSITFSVKASA